MEKFLSPLRNTENDGERTLLEKNVPVQTEEQDMKIVYQKVIQKSAVVTNPVDNKSIKVKKIKVKKIRGEKRKFPDKTDSVKKVKRKKKEEKSGNSSNLNDSSFSEGTPDIKILSVEIAATADINTVSQKDDTIAAENDSDVENHEKPVKQKSSRKTKLVANKCKETLDVLLKFDSDVLDSMGKSLRIVKSHSLLGSKYISIDILLDLISLALNTSKEGSEVATSEKELSLHMIITKCLNEIMDNMTPKRPKGRPSVAPSVPCSPMNKSQDEATPSTPVSKEEVVEKQTPKSQELDETMECSETEAIPEISQEPAVEKSGKNFCITNYFKKLKRTVEERDKNERFSCFATKTDMFLAPKLGGELTGERREKFEEQFTSQNCQPNYLIEQSFKFRRVKRTSAKQEKTVIFDSKSVKESHDTLEETEKSNSDGAETSELPKTEPPTRKRVSLIRVDKPKVESTEAVCRTKAKLFQFHDNRRPPYWGTWRRKSETVGARKPFGRDKLFNYEIDSDDEWEEEEEPGESLHGSDDEKEPEEDYEVDNDFFVPHGYLSDDENPEKENLSPKTKLDLLEEQFTSEQKQKTRKMTPIVFGTFWLHNGLPSEGTLYQDLQIDRLQYVPWTTIPIEIEEEEKRSDLTDHGEPTSQVKKSKQKIFPSEEIPNLIKMIHGSPQNCDQLTRKFLLYWETEKIPEGNRPGLTKVCVQKKIKELAMWQAGYDKGKMCWHVPKETREEFGAEVEKKTPEKKPQKCFFWKFVRKAEKNPGGGPPAASAPPAPTTPLEPEVVILES